MRQIFEDKIGQLNIKMLAMPWQRRDFYISYLTQTYYFVRHSTRLLALAGAYAGLEEDALHLRFSAHIGEEKGHDKLALHDLKKLGIVGLEAEFSETKNLYEGQYYKIERQHPAALFGYILALEGVSSMICPYFVDRLYAAFGVEACRFLKLHIEEDPDHVEKALSEIERLSDDVRRVIESNLIQSLNNYTHFANAIMTGVGPTPVILPQNPIHDLSL